MTPHEFHRRAKYQGGADRRFGKWSVIDIHKISSCFDVGQEVDFYVCDDHTVHLLRLRHSDTPNLYVNQDGKEFGYPDYWILEGGLNGVAIDDDFLQSVLADFEKHQGMR